MTKDFNNKVILITGGTSGLGKEAAKKFLEQGGKVIINSRKHNDVAKETVKELQKISRNIEYVSGDVSVAKDVINLIDSVIKKHGRLDVLVTSAGLNHVGKVEGLSEEVWDLIMDVNLKGTLLCCQQAIPHLKETKGCIVTVASDVGIVPSASLPVYSISKAGVLMLTKLLGSELASSGVRINSVLPANILPGMRNTVTEEENKQVWRHEDPDGPDWVVPPIGRFGKGSEVADAIVFFASDKSSYCTGSHLLVDGALNAAQV